MNVKAKAVDEDNAPRASNMLRYVGFAITAIWIIALVSYGFSNIQRMQELRPNELADFAAGAFAPLAFLWLVLGFFQQGEELRYSGRALWLQGEELRNSVEQQRELVSVTREQLKFENEVLQQQREEHARNAQPKLELRQGGNQGGGPGHRLHDFHMTNHGRPCTDVKIRIVGEPELQAGMALFQTGQQLTFRRELPLGGPSEFEVSVSYLDERLITGNAGFRVFGDGPYSIEAIPR